MDMFTCNTHTWTCLHNSVGIHMHGKVNCRGRWGRGQGEDGGGDRGKMGEGTEGRWGRGQREDGGGDRGNMGEGQGEDGGEDGGGTGGRWGKDRGLIQIKTFRLEHMGQCPAKSSFWIVFQVFKFFEFSMNWKEPLPNGFYASKIGLSIIKLKAIHFNVSVTFLLLVL